MWMQITLLNLFGENLVICAFMVWAYSACVIKKIITSLLCSKSCNGSAFFFFCNKTPNPYDGFMAFVLCPPLPCSGQLISYTLPGDGSNPTIFLAISAASSSPFWVRALVLSFCSSWNFLPICLSIALTFQS